MALTSRTKGTSVAAPLWAGFTALVNQQAALSGNGPIGFLNPALYAIGAAAGYATNFHDITVGNNTNNSSPTNYFAVPGYDLCTGWGTPTGSNLINSLAPPDPLVMLPVPGFASSGPAGGPFSVMMQSFILTNAGSSLLNWSLWVGCPLAFRLRHQWHFASGWHGHSGRRFELRHARPGPGRLCCAFDIDQSEQRPHAPSDIHFGDLRPIDHFSKRFDFSGAAQRTI